MFLLRIGNGSDLESVRILASGMNVTRLSDVLPGCTEIATGQPRPSVSMPLLTWQACRTCHRGRTELLENL